MLRHRTWVDAQDSFQSESGLGHLGDLLAIDADDKFADRCLELLVPALLADDELDCESDTGDDDSLYGREISNDSDASIAVDTFAHGFRDSPDGMTIDTDGNLWVAFCHGGCVACFDPSSDKLLNRVDLPCVETTACTFGGPDLNRLFVTTGIHKSIKEPNAGKVFVIDGLGARGMPAFEYRTSIIEGC